MGQSLTRWQSLNQALGSQNRERLRLLQIAWTRRWQNNQMVGAPGQLAGMFFDMDESGNNMMVSGGITALLGRGVLWNIGIFLDGNDNIFRLRSPTEVAEGGARFLRDWSD